MISKKYISSIFLATALTFAACERVETEPRDWILDTLVWDEQDKNATVAIFFLNNIYSYIPDGYSRVNGDYLETGTDDAIPSRTNRTAEYYTNGLISTVNNPDPYWGTSYAGIRRVNIFLSNIDKVPAASTSIAVWKAEARYIRSLLYFELIKRYGGIPLIGDKVFSINDDLTLPRNTYEECINYIVSECDAVKGTLTPEPISDSNWGKIPRGAAIALKARALLYAASPLFNGGGISTNANLKALMGYSSYDANRWQKALDAANELISLNYYALQTSYSGVFTTKKNTEIILAKQSSNNFQVESFNAPMGFGSPAASQGLTSPSQNLVDAFPTLSGLEITNPLSGYDPQNPYVNRDPRLALTVFFNGQTWLRRSVETFEGGLDKPGGISVQTRTGYYLRKFMADFSTNTTYTNQSHNFPLFRYSEILLNAAEALNELGRTSEAVSKIIDIRKRAGIKAGTDNRYGIKTGISQEEMRTFIQNERRIELAFEEHRFWDIRRWKIAESVVTGSLKGMKIVKSTNASLTYTPIVVSTMRFSNKLYCMPLPYDETLKNPKLIQNEGW